MRSINNQNQGQYYDELDGNSNVNFANSSHRTDQNPHELQQAYRNNQVYSQYQDYSDAKSDAQDQNSNHSEIGANQYQIMNENDLTGPSQQYQAIATANPHKFYTGHSYYPLMLPRNSMVQFEYAPLCQPHLPQIFSPSNSTPYHQDSGGGTMPNSANSNQSGSAYYSAGTPTGACSPHQLYAASSNNQSVTTPTDQSTVRVKAGTQFEGTGKDSVNLQSLYSNFSGLNLDGRNTLYQEKAMAGPPNMLYAQHSSSVAGANSVGLTSSPAAGGYPFQHQNAGYFLGHQAQHHMQGQPIFQNYAGYHQNHPHQFGLPQQHQNHYSGSYHGRQSFYQKNNTIKFTIPLSVIKENPSINPKEFDTTLLSANTRYFVIRSGCAYNVEKAMAHGIWCSTNYGNMTLDAAYCETHNISRKRSSSNNTTLSNNASTTQTNGEKEEGGEEAKNKPEDNSDDPIKPATPISSQKEEKAPEESREDPSSPSTPPDANPGGNEEGGHVILFFSITHSKSICGVAEMTGRFDRSASSGIWSESRWKGQFPINWIYIKQVPDSQISQIVLPKNENKLVTQVKDCTEIWPREKGKSLLRVIHAHPNP